MTEDKRILIVDDEANIRSGLAKGLEREAGTIDTAGSANEALDLFEAAPYNLVIADLRMPGDMDGLQLLGRIHEQRPETLIIMITAHGTVETAVEAMRHGAYDFISKPVDLNLIREQVRKALKHQELVCENRVLRERLADAGEISSIIGSCPAMQEVYRQVRQVADTDATVFITGESGTGKELIAHAIHQLSHRSEGPFIPVNVGALPDTLLESELFGHEKGAFTGASRQRPGCFERASGGTLFLDEVTEMSAKSQIDLLRVLETGEFFRVGGETVLHSDARIVSATNRGMQTLLEDGTFREDLYYRLNVVPIELPPLRERREDIPLLVSHFVEHFSARHRRPPRQISPEALNVLTSYNWPGNVRQLRNLVERLSVTAIDETIGTDDLPPELQVRTGPPGEVNTLADAVEQAEKVAIQSALSKCECHRENTAKLLGISVRTLHYKMNRYALH
ncbi:response regulator [bacterium]|nr:response regulator [bacterium]